MIDSIVLNFGFEAKLFGFTFFSLCEQIVDYKILLEESVINTQLPELTAVSLKTFFNLASLWHLTDYQMKSLLGRPSNEIFITWQNQDETGHITDDVMIRISHLLGIHLALKTLLKGASTYEWIHKNNNADLFKGASALSYMLGGVDQIELVHQYTESLCH